MEPVSKFDEVTEFRRTLDPETDRGCALMAAAYLDDQLKKLLSKSLVQHEKLHKKIFEPTGILGTFSARINFAYLLGHIGPKALRDLHLIREIRNDFGHIAKPLSFEEPRIADKCRELYHDVSGLNVSARSKFTRVVLGVLGPIHALEAITHPKTEGRDIPIDAELSGEFLKGVDRLIEALRKADLPEEP